MKKHREVVVETLRASGFEGFIVRILNRSKYERRLAAQFDYTDAQGRPRTIESVKEWVRRQHHLTLVEPEAQNQQYVPVWSTHHYTSEGGNKIHLAPYQVRGSTVISVPVLCKRRMTFAQHGVTIPDLSKWLETGRQEVCKLCVARALGNTPFKGGTSTWGGPLAKPE